MLGNVAIRRTPTAAGAAAPAPLPARGAARPAAGTAFVLANSGMKVRLVPDAARPGEVSLALVADDGIMALTSARGDSRPVIAGAVHGRRAGRPWSLAWGRLRPGGISVCAEFVGESRGRAPRTISATLLAEGFWIAETAGDYRGVTITTADSRLHSELWPVPRVRPAL
ncbi:hypothetical protein [Streptomyces sp. YKOK-I1]